MPSHDLNTCRSSTRDSRAGFTIIELTIVMGLAVVLLGGVITAYLACLNNLVDGMQDLTLRQTARRVMERVASEVRLADLATLDYTDDDTITYQCVTGYNTTTNTAILSAVRTIEFSIETGEGATAGDDDGDGLVDEGFIFYTETGNDPIELARDVLDFHVEPSPGGGPAVLVRVIVGDIGTKQENKQVSLQEEVAVRN